PTGIRELPQRLDAHRRPARRRVGWAMTQRWIVDASNVIGSWRDAWWKDRRAAMVTLVGRLEQWASAEHQVTVVFERPLSPPINSSVIEIAHAPRAAANSADDE